MNKLRLTWRALRLQSTLLIVTLATITLYLYKLARIPTGGLASEEKTAAAASSGLHTILVEPLFLPLNVLRYAGQTLGPAHANLALRLPSVGIALLTIAALLYVTRRWYGQRTYYFSLILIPCSAWLLHTGRLGANDILYVAVVPLLLATSLLLHDLRENKLVLWCWMAVLGLCLYLPGAFWLAAATIVWQRSLIKETGSNLSWVQRIALCVSGLLLITPLIYGLITQGSLDYALAWLGVPITMLSIGNIVANLVAAILFVGIRTPENPSLWLGQLPVLDAFLTVCMIAGVLFYANHLKAERTRLLILYGAIAMALSVLNGAIMRNLLVPLLYLLAFGGIAFILHQWLKMFPRNPIARRLGIGLICAAVTLSAIYNVRQYFVAWPHNNDTKQAFIAKQ